jgi:hypothetical protein
MFRGSVVSKLKRVGCGLVGVLAIAFGLFHPQHAYSYSYRNWFGGLVFGPVVAVLGAIGARSGTHHPPFTERNSLLEDFSVHRFVIAGRAAGLAVHQAVGAETHALLRLAENAKLFAPALCFGLFALGAKDPA